VYKLKNKKEMYVYDLDIREDNEKSILENINYYLKKKNNMSLEASQ